MALSNNPSNTIINTGDVQRAEISKKSSATTKNRFYSVMLGILLLLFMANMVSAMEQFYR